MRFNVALFRYWYQDLQVFDITNEADTIPQPELLNADARVLGAEVDLELRPIPEVWIDLSSGWLDSEFEEFTVEKRILQGRRDAQPQKFNYKGNPLIASPEYSFNGIIEIEIPLGRYGSLVPNYNASYRSKIFLDPQAIDPISQPAYWLHNARLSWRHEDGRLEVAGWVQNFMDEQYKVDVFDITREFDSIIEVWSEPRLYGFTVSMRF
jgi:iron complex outermembrane receptor protein